MLPCFEGVTHADGSQYEPTNCWKDLYKHICEAERFIYITGKCMCCLHIHVLGGESIWAFQQLKGYIQE